MTIPKWSGIVKHIFFAAAVSAVLLVNNASGTESDIRRRAIMDERLGQRIPGGLIFRDEDGKSVSLEKLLDKPAIVSFVYLRCSSICPLLLGNLAATLDKVDLVPGEDYRVITISFDAADTPEDAALKKKNYIKAAGKTFPESSWKFLTGDEESIRRLTGALGFRYMKEGHGFSHPRGLIFLSPDGVVRRYLNGASFQPFDVKMALTESQDKTSLSQFRLFSYSYARDENRYVFNFLKILGTVVVSFLASLAFFYALTRRMRLQNSERSEKYINE